MPQEQPNFIEQPASPEERRETVLSPEKEAEYRQLLEQAKRISYMFPIAVGERPAHSTEEDHIEARNLWLRFNQEGEPFAAFLINQMDQAINEEHGQSDFYHKLQIFKTLPTEQANSALVKWLDDERVWNYPDGSNVHNILEEFSERKDESFIPAVARYIQNIGQPNYRREKHGSSDFCSAASTLIKIARRNGLYLTESVCRTSPLLNEWFHHHLQYLEIEAERNSGPSQGIASIDYSKFLDQSILEKIKEQEERERLDFQQILIRGSAVLTQILNKDKKLVRDVDIFLIKKNWPKNKFEVREFKNIEEAKNIFSENDFEKIKKWIDDSGNFEKPVHVVTTTEEQLRGNDVYMNEPELVLFDKRLEALSKIYKPLSQKDYESLSREVSDLFSDDFTKRQATGNSLVDAFEVGKYATGKLIRGEVPRIIFPNGTLARALRAIDIGKRFDIRVDDSFLRDAYKAVSSGSLLLSVRPVEIMQRTLMSQTDRLRRGIGEIAGIFDNEWYQERPQGEPVVDEPFMKVVSKKEQFKVLKQNYPHLGTLVEKIQEAGGLESFIEKEYGKVYLHRGKVHLYDVNLTKSPASISEQVEFLKLWDSHIERSVHFPCEDVKKISNEVDFPKSEKVQNLIDKNSLEKALKGRFSSHLATILGAYEVQVDKAMSAGIQEKIKALLGMFHLCWNDAIKDSKANLTTQLIKLGVHNRNPVLAELDETRGHNVKLVMTDDIEAILGASTDKPWTSCIDLDRGAFSGGLYEDVKNGSVIAYLLNGNNLIGRVILRPTKTFAKGLLGKSENAVGIERYYGDERYKKTLLDSLKKIFDENGIIYQKRSASIKSFSRSVWSDNGSQDANGHFVYSWNDLRYVGD